MTLAVNGGQLPLLVNLVALTCAGTAVILAVVAELHDRLDNKVSALTDFLVSPAPGDPGAHRRPQQRVRQGLPAQPRPGGRRRAVRPAGTGSRRTLTVGPSHLDRAPPRRRGGHLSAGD